MKYCVSDCPFLPNVRAIHPYLLLDLQALVLRDRDSCPPRAGVNHPLLNRRSARACVYEYNDFRARVVVVGIPGRLLGDMASDGGRVNVGLSIDKLYRLSGNIDSLHIESS